MYAITLLQPYAQLIADGVKPYETRSWKPPGHLIGQRIVIHAAKRKVRSPGLHTSIPIDPFGDYSLGRYVWSLIDIEKLVTPVEAKGAQGVWKCDIILE